MDDLGRQATWHSLSAASKKLFTFELVLAHGACAHNESGCSGSCSDGVGEDSSGWRVGLLVNKRSCRRR